MKEGRKPEYPEKTPGDELQKFELVCIAKFTAGLYGRDYLCVHWGAGIAQLVVLGLAVHSVPGSILLWGHFR